MNPHPTPFTDIHSTDSTSFVNVLVPPARSSGVLIRMSQSITQTCPLGESSTFSSCKSLKYMSFVAKVQLRGLTESKPIRLANSAMLASFIIVPCTNGCSTTMTKSPLVFLPNPKTLISVSSK